MDFRPAIVASLLAVSCTSGSPASETQSLESPMPADRMAQVKAALPQVAFPGLATILKDPDTIWYDHESMTPTYQETGAPGGGARDNAHWHDLVADSLNDIAVKIYDDGTKNWRFPFAATAGTDDADNVHIVNFLSLPKDQGKVVPIPISTQSDDIHTSWVWQYPNGTVVGEVIFIKDGNDLLPTEVRMRQRYAGGWATNAFRPFPRAQDLDAAIKARRPDWARRAGLSAVVAQLENPGSLAPKQLTATGLPGTFDQAGYLDVLPDFGDDALVRDLLRTTTFASAYGQVWKQNGQTQAFAASTASPLSIVPRNYAAGVIAVTEDSCMRCHKEAARKLEEFYQPITLYGEIWGKDAIFTFHPFDESYYPDLDLNEVDNRHMNPKLQAMGVIEAFDPAKHTGKFYDRH